MLVDKENVYELTVRDTSTKIVLEVRANGARLLLGYGTPSCVINFDVDDAEEQKTFVEIVEAALESSLSTQEFFLKLISHPNIPDFFGCSTTK